MQKYYIAAICSAKNLGYARLQKLLNFFEDAESAWKADNAELQQAGLPDNALKSFLEFRLKNPNAPTQLMEYCQKKNIGVCSIVDENYPITLKEISTPPPVFYYYGKIKTFAERIAMVGARDNTDYGKRVALEISKKLAKAGISIVSGAAKGIDTFSHAGAMKNGRTVAVLGYGIDYAFTPQHKKFIRSIAENGVAISDFNPFQPPTAGTFPARNRIIAGLSRGVIVVEAGEKSGSDIACTYAKKYGRDIFAVPGNIDSEKSIGCNRLIRDGAILIRSADDVLKFYEDRKIKNG